MGHPYRHSAFLLATQIFYLSSQLIHAQSIESEPPIQLSETMPAAVADEAKAFACTLDAHGHSDGVSSTIDTNMDTRVAPDRDEDTDRVRVDSKLIQVVDVVENSKKISSPWLKSERSQIHNNEPTVHHESTTADKTTNTPTRSSTHPMLSVIFLIGMGSIITRRRRKTLSL